MASIRWEGEWGQEWVAMEVEGGVGPARLDVDDAVC